MYKLRIEAFQFKGGDRSELDEERSQLGRSEWNAIVAKLASTHPSVFPTHPRNIPSGVRDMSFINLPISDMPGYRAHCVYFSHTITRTFWNVLCFAYRESDCPLRALAAVSADEWYSIGISLAHSSQELSLPSADGAELSPPLPAYESTQAIFYRFPTTREQLITSAEDNWELCLEDAKKAPSSYLRSQSIPKPSRFERFRKNKKINIHIGRFFGISRGIVFVYGIAIGIATGIAAENYFGIAAYLKSAWLKNPTQTPETQTDTQPTRTVQTSHSPESQPPETEDTPTTNNDQFNDCSKHYRRRRDIHQSPMDNNTDNAESDSTNSL